MARKDQPDVDRAARMCPSCGCDSVVRRSVELSDGSILRKRRCKACGTQFETIEKFFRVIYMAGKD